MLSVVIPALNAGTTIASCLACLATADEIVVVDGGSSDDTRAIAIAGGASVIETEPGRGRQMRAGAQAARGEWLLFLHADTCLPTSWRNLVATHIETNPRRAACFHLGLDDVAWQARLIERAVAFRTRPLGLPYGDQGLLISRALYEALGGFRPLPLMEDVDLVRRIGLARLTVLDGVAVTSASRWRAEGWWRRSARNLFCLSLYLLGVEPSRIARIYA